MDGASGMSSWMETSGWLLQATGYLGSRNLLSNPTGVLVRPAFLLPGSEGPFGSIRFMNEELQRRSVPAEPSLWAFGRRREGERVQPSMVKTHP